MLPSFKWLLVGALAAGIWVVRHDDAAKPRPPLPVKKETSAGTVPAKTAAIVLPRVSERPPAKPLRAATASISKPGKPAARQLQATERVRARKKADISAPVAFVLEPGQNVTEIARSGAWRLVGASGRRGWVHGDYLSVVPRPKASVPTKIEAAKAMPVKKP